MSTRRLLTDPLPLRRAVDLPEYRADAAERWLPWVFGRAHVAAVPLDATGRDWLVADHPVVAVTAVSVDGQQTTGYELIQRLDATGHPVSIVRLSRPAGTAQVTAQVSGRRDERSGALVESPASVVRAIFTAAGWQVGADDYAGLDDDYPGAVLAHVIDSETTLREAIGAVLHPLGALWRHGVAMRAQPGSPQAHYTAREVETIRASAALSDISSRARVRYGLDHATGVMRGALHLSAPDLDDARVADIDLPSVTRPRDALSIGSALLADVARAVWDVELTVGARHAARLMPGDTITLDHPHAPAGYALVTRIQRDRERGLVSITCRLPSSVAPRVEMIRASTALDAAEPQHGVLYRDGQATFTVTDPAGNPLAGAQVTLDGAQTGNTNRQGQVSFKTERGPHTLLVSAAGFAPFEMGVVV